MVSDNFASFDSTQKEYLDGALGPIDPPARRSREEMSARSAIRLLITDTVSSSILAAVRTMRGLCDPSSLSLLTPSAGERQ